MHQHAVGEELDAVEFHLRVISELRSGFVVAGTGKDGKRDGRGRGRCMRGRDGQIRPVRRRSGHVHRLSVGHVKDCGVAQGVGPKPRQRVGVNERVAASERDVQHSLHIQRSHRRGGIHAPDARLLNRCVHEGVVNLDARLGIEEVAAVDAGPCATVAFKIGVLRPQRTRAERQNHHAKHHFFHVLLLAYYDKRSPILLIFL